MRGSSHGLVTVLTSYPTALEQMLPFKLGFSVVLLVVGLLSAAILCYTWPRQIKLDRDGDHEPLEGGFDVKLRDPFDILRPGDTIDGYPIAQDDFWKKMRIIKFFMYVPHPVHSSNVTQRR